MRNDGKDHGGKQGKFETVILPIGVLISMERPRYRCSDMPPIHQVGATFKKAPKAVAKGDETGDLPL